MYLTNAAPVLPHFCASKPSDLHLAPLPRLREVHQRGGRSCQPPVPAKGCPARLFWGSLAPEWGEFTQVALQQLEKKKT